MRRLLSKKEVIAAIDGKENPRHVPALYTTWFNPFVYTNPLDFMRSIVARLRYPDDIAVCGWHDLRWHLYHMDRRNGSFLRCVILGLGAAPPPKRKYLKEASEGMDTHILLEDMKDVDSFIARLPDPKKAIMLFPGPSRRYKLSWNFSALFENHWNIRGMENALMDYYLYPEETHRLYRALTDYAKVLIRRAKKSCHADGVFMSDDIGTQTGPFFSPDVFREFFLPYYKELIDCAHSLGMHFWFHSCGDVTMFLDMLVDAGLDVIHPIQKFAMDQEAVFEKYRDRITFFYGFDLQRVIPEGTPDEVEEEVRRTMGLFSTARGRLVYTSGNAFTGDCPIRSFERLMRVSHTLNPYKERNGASGKTPGK